VTKVLERYVAEIQAHANRARSLGLTAPDVEPTRSETFERDLDQFVQTIIQDLQDRHHSD
jgi:hypothetical protein